MSCSFSDVYKRMESPLYWLLAQYKGRFHNFSLVALPLS